MDVTSASQPRYSRVAMVLHWAIAVMIICNLVDGYFLKSTTGPRHVLILVIHALFGLTVLTLTAIRVLWRVTHKPPPFPADMATWERHSASIVHFLLYAAMVLMPLSGWAILSSHPAPGSPGMAAAMREAAAAREAAASADGGEHQPAQPQPAAAHTAPRWAPTLPMITPLQQIGETEGGVQPQKVLGEKFMAFHGAGAFWICVLLLLHVGGALKHQVFDRHDELARMGLRLRRARAG